MWGNAETTCFPSRSCTQPPLDPPRKKQDNICKRMHSTNKYVMYHSRNYISLVRDIIIII